MKRLLGLLCVVFAVLMFSCAKESGSETSDSGETSVEASTSAVSNGKYQVKSGILEYAMGAGGVEMKKMYYFDDFGKKEQMEIYYEGSLSEVQFTDGVNRYTYRGADEDKVVWNQGPASHGISPVIKTSGMSSQRGVTVMPSMNLLGFDCEAYVVETGGTTVTMAGYKGVQMFMESKGKMETHDKAVKAEFDVAIPGDKFLAPAAYEVKSM